MNSALPRLALLGLLLACEPGGRAPDGFDPFEPGWCDPHEESHPESAGVPASCDLPMADLPTIRNQGILRVALPADGSSALLDRGRLRGFELDLIRSFAMRQDVHVDLHVVDGLDARLEGLLDGRFDVVARREPGEPSLDGASSVHLSEQARILVRTESTALRAALDDFAASQRERIERLWERYDGYRARPQASSFDTLFRSQAAPWRWTLLAAVAWQESRFDPQARSSAGALGMMQLVPATAARYGTDDPHDPEQAIRGGSRFLASLDRRFRASIPDTEARLPFVLASYNAGPGHVDDARALTEHLGGDPDSWAQVAPWLRALQDRRYYRLPFVEHGYCRGSEPVDYVEKVLRRRALYDALLPED